MRVAEEARGRAPKHLVGVFLFAVRPLADRIISLLTLVAFAAEDRERDNDAFADFEFAVKSSADFDDFAHELVAEDVALLQSDHEVIIKMQITAADCAAG